MYIYIYVYIYTYIYSVVPKADNLPPSCAVVTKSRNLNFLEPSGPVQAFNGTALYIYIYICTGLFKMIVGVQLSSVNSAPNSGNNHNLTIPFEGVCTVSGDRVRVYPGTEGTNQNRH